MLVRLRRSAVLVVLTALVLAGLTATASAGRRARPVWFPQAPHGLAAPVAQPGRAEEASGWFPQVSCNPVTQRGVRLLRDLVLETYDRGYDGGTTRSCVSGSSSEHKEGRAWDWMLNVHNRRDRRTAGHFLSWLTEAGPDGEPGLQARRLGVMYVIYNRRIWRSYRPRWESYSGYSPHTDHIHISFSWAGARGRTSFWTGKVGGTDYGPCSRFVGQPAVLTRRANPHPCDSPSPLVRRSHRPTVEYGAVNSRPVRAAQRLLGVKRSGDFDRRTWREVKRFQRGHDLPVTGVLDQPTWGSLNRRSVRWFATEGYGPRRAARYGLRHFADVRLHPGSHGVEVAFVQKALRLHTSYRTGLIGRHTAEALRDFKDSHGMRRNAWVNRRVWEELAGR